MQSEKGNVFTARLTAPEDGNRFEVLEGHSTTLHADFNFSSTYSESSIMRSATCSAD
jgi:hypothetical protein